MAEAKWETSGSNDIRPEDADKNIIPNTSGDVGTSSNRWGKGWFESLDVSGVANMGSAAIDGSADVGGVYKVDGNQVVADQLSAITDISPGGAGDDIDAREKINAILYVLRTHGLIAT